MKTIIQLLGLFLFISTVAVGQTDVNEDRNTTLPSFNIHNSADYIIKGKVLDLYVTEYTIIKKGDPDEEVSFTLRPNTPESFRQNFTENLKAISDGDSKMKEFTDQKAKLEDEANKLYYFFMASERAIESVDEAPDAGRLCFNKLVPVELEKIDQKDIRRLRNAIKTSLRSSKNQKLDSAHLVSASHSNIEFLTLARKWKPKEKRRTWHERIDRYTIKKMNKETMDGIARLKSEQEKIAQHVSHEKKQLKGDSALLSAERLKYELAMDSLSKVVEEIKSLQRDVDGKTNQIVGHALMARFTSNETDNLGTFLSNAGTFINNEIVRLEADKSAFPTRSDSTRTMQQIVSDSLKTRLIDDQLLELQGLASIVKDLYKDKTVIDNLHQERNLLAGQSESIRKGIDSLVSSINTHILNLSNRQNEEQLNCFALSNKRRELLVGQVNVSAIAIEFNDGFMENIVVEANLQFQEDKCPISSNPLFNFLKFDNRYPIGFSDKNNYKRGKYFLYATAPNGFSYKMSLNQLFPEYIENLKVDRRDFSPKDYVFEVDMTSEEYCQAIKKDETSKLFEAKVYSDFVGLSDDREPNGLVQTEISKRVNINTKRYIFQVPRYIFQVPVRITAGFFGYVEPEITISKIENNNRRLLLDTKDRLINNRYVPLKYASTLDLRRYQNFSAGLDFNVFLLDLPFVKSTFYVNGGFRYGRTAVRDSLRTFNDNEIIHEKLASDYAVNTLDFYPTVIWQIRADERYCFDFSYSHHWFNLRDNRFEQVGNTETFSSTEAPMVRINKEFTKIGMYATLNPSDDNKGKLFFRYHYFWQQGFWRTGFHQAQVGYSFFILGSRSAD